MIKMDLYKHSEGHIASSLEGKFLITQFGRTLFEDCVLKGHFALCLERHFSEYDR